jgi:hypothetical protein
MAQQTAVQMLLEYINKHGFDMEYEMEMSFLDHEKDQIKDAWANGGADLMSSLSHPKQHMRRNAEQYYNETYNK